MAAYFSDRAQPGIQPKLNIVGDTSTIGIFNVTGPLNVGDTITMFSIPGAPAGVFLSAMQLDMNGVDGGTGLTVSVGMAGAPAAFIQNGKQSVAGSSIQGLNVPGTIGYVFPAQLMPEVGYPIIVTVTGAPTTPTGAGTIVLRAAYAADR